MNDSANGRNVVMQVSRASKRYSLSPEKARRPGTRELFLAMIGFRKALAARKLRDDEFWAVRDVTFNLHRGEALGIVGLNGAGKSTLLKMILGRLRADEGNIRVHGKAGGLIELGAGFHHELSGRRNIFVSASLLGVPEAEVEKKIDEIITFADIGRFIDSPVKTYSSGMRVRLGFSVAVHFVPDVLICDEVLSVGDFEFRQKCLQRIKEVRRTRSVLLVSHSTRDIALFCNKAMLLHRGEMIMLDEPEKVLKAYSICTKHVSADEVRRRVEKLLKSKDKPKSFVAAGKQENGATGKKRNETRRPAAPDMGAKLAENRPLEEDPSPSGRDSPIEPSKRTSPPKQPKEVTHDDELRRKLFGPEYWNEETIEHVAVSWNMERNEKGFYLISGEPLYLQLSFRLKKPVERFRIGLPVFDDAGVMILGPDSRHSPDAKKVRKPGKYSLTMTLDPLPLNSGRFSPAISICDDPAQLFRQYLPSFEIFNPGQEFGVAKTFSVWTANQDGTPPLESVLKS